ncbi:MAG: hypothetical protein IPN49_12745 [Saprospiraceae bacterium]|nr:hypothetical protein [Saprospiraceae bacterium]
MFDARSFDNCTGISHITVTPSVVTCNDVSPKTVEVRVYDNAGNGIMPRLLLICPMHRILFSRWPAMLKF